MSEDTINLDFILLEKILNQLIMSDGMEVTHQYLIDKHIYYIDNTAIIEELEELIITTFYEKIYEIKGNVNYDELLKKYNPQFINFDKLYEKLEKNHIKQYVFEKDSLKKADITLNKYL